MTVKGIAARRETAGPWSFLERDATGAALAKVARRTAAHGLPCRLSARVLLYNTPLALLQASAGASYTRPTCSTPFPFPPAEINSNGISYLAAA